MLGPPFGKFYPITDSRGGDRGGLVEQAETLLKAGVGFFQVREKRLDDGPLHRLLLEVANLCRRAGASFIVNDRVDLALAVGASGVHLGQTDLPPEAARQLLGPAAVIGLSTHSEEQFKRALSRPIDYVAVGPVFATSTKPGRRRPLGLEFVRAARGWTDLPLVAIGGIGINTAEAVWRAGADSVAVISDLWDSPDPGERARRFLEAAAAGVGAPGRERVG